MAAPSLFNAGLPAGLRFIGHAIVSADGMISAADGSMPAGLQHPADWQRFQAALDGSVLVVLGSAGHRRHPNSGRRRLVFTSQVQGIAPDPADRFAVFFNPAGASLADVLARLDIGTGAVAVTGGTRIFDAFLPLYHRFELTEVNRLAVPDGRPCFTAGHPRTVLATAGLVPLQFDLLDDAAGVSATAWARPSPGH